MSNPSKRSSAKPTAQTKPAAAKKPQAAANPKGGIAGGVEAMSLDNQIKRAGQAASIAKLAGS